MDTVNASWKYPRQQNKYETPREPHDQARSTSHRLDGTAEYFHPRYPRGEDPLDAAGVDDTRPSGV